LRQCHRQRLVITIINNNSNNTTTSNKKTNVKMWSTLLHWTSSQQPNQTSCNAAEINMNT
jgi:hypothetical protein